MMLWAVVAEWVKAGVGDPPPHHTVRATSPPPTRLELLRKESFASTPSLFNDHHGVVGEDSQPLWLRLWMEKSQRKQMRRLKRKERYRESLQRKLILGEEMSIESDDPEVNKATHWTVTYRTDPLRIRELHTNRAKEEEVHISCSSDCRGDTALVSYNYNTFQGHNANWLVCGTGGPVSLTSRGELGESEFEQETGLTLRSGVCSHPIETDLRGAVRINYLTDNVDLRWKGAVKYPIMNNWVKVAHGIETEELHGCCWTFRAEKHSDSHPWRSVKMETSGSLNVHPVTVEHVRAELIRNLTASLDIELEAKTPINRRGTKWTTRLKKKSNHKKEYVAYIEGENSAVNSFNLRCNYAALKTNGVAWSAGYRPDDGWNVTGEFRVGQQGLRETRQQWNFKTEVKLAEGGRRRKAHLQFFVPL